MKQKTALLFAAVRRWWNALRDSEFMRGAATLTLFPQLPEVDSSPRAQREALAQIWRDVGGYVWSAYRQETETTRRVIVRRVPADDDNDRKE